MMKAVVLVLVVAVAASSVRVVQGQTSELCDGLSKKNCEEKEECTFNSFYEDCILTAGKGSVVRDGSENVAPGKYCAVGGGKQNEAGDTDDTHSVIGGGYSNICFQGSKNTISGGKLNSIANGDFQEFDTISGGSNNEIANSSNSVITGGGGPGMDKFDKDGDSNLIRGEKKSTISGGRKNRIIRGSGSISSGHTISGGDKNSILDSDSNGAITGGKRNSVEGRGAVVVGGASNRAYGRNSLAFGQNADTEFDHSMVVNLIGGTDFSDDLKGTEEGEFLMNANSFRFQIGNGKEKGGAIQFTKMTYDNIDNLASALAE